MDNAVSKTMFKVPEHGSQSAKECWGARALMRFPVHPIGYCDFAIA